MLDTTRREFVALVGGGCLLLAAKVRRARAQQPAKIPRIGILDDAPMWQLFRQALRELGYDEGQNIAYEYRDKSIAQLRTAGDCCGAGF